ncbi:MAG TPA: hypothetical protein DEQ25_03290 [Methylophaga sp.]|nr:hypothetical protein [Methylophaga sp.]
MQRGKTTSFVLMLMLAVSGCASTPHVQPVAIDCPKPAPVPAWIMEPPPDLQKTLNRLITISNQESPE